VNRFYLFIGQLYSKFSCKPANIHNRPTATVTQYVTVTCSLFPVHLVLYGWAPALINIEIRREKNP